MLQLYAETQTEAIPSDTSAGVSSSSSSRGTPTDSTNAKVSRESRCLKLVTTDIGYMIKYWLPFSKQVSVLLTCRLSCWVCSISSVFVRVGCCFSIAGSRGYSHLNALLGLSGAVSPLFHSVCWVCGPANDHWILWCYLWVVWRQGNWGTFDRFYGDCVWLRCVWYQ